MKGLFIVGGIAAVLLLILFFPVSAEAAFDGQWFLKLRLAGIPVFWRDFGRGEKPKPKKKNAKAKKEPSEKPETPKKRGGFFAQLKENYGLGGALSQLFSFVGSVLKKFKKLLRHMVFDRLEFSLVFAGDDAAQTAISYGELCAAVYPVFAFLDMASNVRMKQVNLRADFENGESKVQVGFAIRVRTMLIFLGTFALSALLEFFKFKKQVGEKDEREQH
ncbi:MAG: DUF2953 domain-containing protein [Clostridia bacterium]|nr:DUF2953 domain-containing protein [Clostridia bacterium]